jgi:type III pantothenate kinase
MLLCIDLGNSNIKLGLFDSEKLRFSWRINTNRAALADEYAVLLLNLFEAEQIDPVVITRCAISSVVPGLTQEFIELSRRHLKLEPLVPVTNEIPGLQINTENPSEVGIDLAMNALAARQLFGTPVIIIGLGTATTFTAVSAGGVLEGVAIAPGVLTSANSLFSSTSTLPRIALNRPDFAIGKNTIKSLQSGLVFGFTALIEGVVARIQTELGGNAHVVATGGLAPVIAAETNVIQAIEPNLALIGLRLYVELLSDTKH